MKTLKDLFKDEKCYSQKMEEKLSCKIPILKPRDYLIISAVLIGSLYIFDSVVREEKGISDLKKVYENSIERKQALER